jgi:hypothetical protein
VRFELCVNELNIWFVGTIRTLESHKWERQRRGLAEEEGQRHVETLDDADILSGIGIIEVGHPPVGCLLITRVVQLGVNPEPVGVDLINLRCGCKETRVRICEYWTRRRKIKDEMWIT